jgi:hypothetical protein
LYDCSLQSLPFQVRINIGWWKSVSDNENHKRYLLVEKNRKILLTVTKQWIAVTQSKKRIKLGADTLLANWIQRRKLQIIVVQQWKLITASRRILVLKMIEKWKRLVLQNRVTQVQEEKMKKEKQCRKYFEKWKEKQRNKNGVKEHKKIEWLQLERINIHFLTKVLGPCFSHVSNRVKSNVFLNELQVYAGLLTDVTKSTSDRINLIATCKKLLASNFPSTMKTTVLLNSSLNKHRSFLKLLSHLNQAIRNFENGLEDLPTFILPELLSSTLAKIQATIFHIRFDTRHLWNKKTSSLPCSCFLPEETATEITKAWLQSPMKNQSDLIHTLNSLVMIIQMDECENDDSPKEIHIGQQTELKEQCLFPIHFT